MQYPDYHSSGGVQTVSRRGCLLHVPAHKFDVLSLLPQSAERGMNTGSKAACKDLHGSGLSDSPLGQEQKCVTKCGNLFWVGHCAGRARHDRHAAVSEVCYS